MTPLHIVHGRAADRARLRLTRRNDDKDSGVGQSCRKRFDAKLKKAGARQAASRRSLPSPCFFQFCIEPFSATLANTGIFVVVSARQPESRPVSRAPVYYM